MRWSSAVSSNRPTGRSPKTDRIALGSAATLHALLARGRLHLAQGRGRDLRATGNMLIVNNPSYVRGVLSSRWHWPARNPTTALELADGELVRARELGQPRGIVFALRARGILEGGEGGIALLVEAVQTLRDSPASLELARALCDLGSAQRRAGAAALRGSRCARRSNSLSATPRRWPGEPEKSCSQLGPIRGASACRVLMP